jgi:hypothetical protein
MGGHSDGRGAVAGRRTRQRQRHQYTTEHDRGHAGQSSQPPAAPAQQPATPDQVRGRVNACVAAGNVAQRQFEQVFQVVHG